jgi:DNA-3-methyladenine glycosylase II
MITLTDYATAACKLRTNSHMPARRRTSPADPTIETPDDIRRGCRALRRRCPHMRMIHEAIGDPPLRRREGGFPGLARIVVGQQLSIASADAIWARLSTGIHPFEPIEVLRREESELRGYGLSRPKIKTLRGIAASVVEGQLDFNAIQHCDEDQLRERLMALPGIGPWSADIYRLFCLGAQDGFAPGDLALQEAARIALQSESRPGQNELLAIAERWKPWRGVAARLLWSYYAQARSGQADPPRNT